MTAVTVVLEGGLGNQLFGAAFGLEVAKARGLPVVLNSGRLVARPYALDTLPGFEETLSDVGVATAHEWTEPRRLRKLRRSWRRESSFAFDSSLFSPRPGDIISGYLQSSKYFPTTRSFVTSTLQRSLRELPIQNSEMASIMTGSYSVAHVRRGDYLGLLDFHGICTIPYFRSALDRLRIDSPLVVVTDDPNGWELTASLEPALVLTPSSSGNAAEVLKIMAGAEDLIMSNSSLSWWGALLTSDASRVVAPRPWFSVRSIDTADLLEPTWLTLDRLG